MPPTPTRDGGGGAIPAVPVLRGHLVRVRGSWGPAAQGGVRLRPSEECGGWDEGYDVPPAPFS